MGTIGHSRMLPSGPDGLLFLPRVLQYVLQVHGLLCGGWMVLVPLVTVEVIQHQPALLCLLTRSQSQATDCNHQQIALLNLFS